MNTLYVIELHPPENIHKVYLWMHSGGQTPPLQWMKSPM